MCVFATDCTEEDPGDHTAGQTAGTETPAGRRRVTAPLQVTSKGGFSGRQPMNVALPKRTETYPDKGEGQGGHAGQTSSTGIKTKELY